MHRAPSKGVVRRPHLPLQKDLTTVSANILARLASASLSTDITRGTGRKIPLVVESSHHNASEKAAASEVSASWSVDVPSSMILTLIVTRRQRSDLRSRNTGC